MKKRNWMPKIVGVVATSAAIMSRKSPEIKKMMPKVDKVLADFKPGRKKSVGSMIMSGMLGFGLAYMMPKAKNMME